MRATPENILRVALENRGLVKSYIYRVETDTQSMQGVVKAFDYCQASDAVRRIIHRMSRDAKYVGVVIKPVE